MGQLAGMRVTSEKREEKVRYLPGRRNSGGGGLEVAGKLHPREREKRKLPALLLCDSSDGGGEIASGTREKSRSRLGVSHLPDLSDGD